MRKKERKVAEVSVLKTVTLQPGIYPITFFFFSLHLKLANQMIKGLILLELN